MEEREHGFTGIKISIFLLSMSGEIRKIYIF